MARDIGKQCSSDSEKNTKSLRDKFTRRKFVQATGASAAVSMAGCLGNGGNGGGSSGFTFGALFATSGSVEVIGQPMMNSVELAVNQINADGGINGEEINLVKRDNGSDPATGIEESRSLINDENADIVFGAYTSAMRDAITETFVTNEVPLWYPTLYEGSVCEAIGDDIVVPRENLEWLFFNGAVPKQQISPYVPWLVDNLDVESFYLIGNDYIWPRTTNTILKDFIDENDGEVVGENYVPLGFTDWGSELQDIRDADPDIVYFTTVGDTQVSMIRQAAELGLTDEMEWAGNIMSEQEARAAGDGADGIYNSAPYFINIDSEENDQYIGSYRDEYGEDTTPNFVSEAAYWGVQMTVQAIEEADDVSGPTDIRDALESDITLQAPQGEVQMDPGTHHCALQSRVGEYNADSEQFEIREEFGRIEPSGISVQANCLE
jgi:ABC-type branched-subunit amino acid transport system substrate-binding protein